MLIQRYINAYILFPLLEKRSGRKIAQKVRELKAFEKLDTAAQEKIRRESAFSVLSHARHHSPYYRDIFRSLSFDETKVLTDLRYLDRLPLLTKDLVRENSVRLRLPAANNARKTGGSTGQSVFFYYDNDGIDWTSAINTVAYEMVGNFAHRRDAHISSEIGVGPVTRKDKFLDWLKLFAQNRSRVFIRSFSESDLAQSFAQLNRIRPYLLQGHPSSAYALAKYISDHQLEGPRYCTVFEPSGETVTPKIAAAVQRELNCKVTNRYGNAEFGVMAHSRFQDDYTRLKIFNRAFYVEPCEKNSLIVSNFTNFSFPLFRYDTGDIGTVRDEVDGSYLYDLQGRIHDSVAIGNEVYATHYLQDFLDHKVRGVREFQIIVADGAHPQLSLVAENATDEARIRSEIESRWPSGLTVQFVKHEDLVRVGWQNKFRHIIEKRQ